MDSALASLDSAAVLAYAIRMDTNDEQEARLRERRQALGNRIARELDLEAALEAILVSRSQKN
jgi:hypothetical protein